MNSAPRGARIFRRMSSPARTLRAAALSLLAASCATFPEPAAEYEREPDGQNRAAVLFGARSFEDDAFWAPVEDEGAVGFEFSHVGPSGLGFEVGAQGSLGYEDRPIGDFDVTGAVGEIYGGVRYALGRGRLQPYVGAGGALLAAGIDDDNGPLAPDDEDVSGAYYVHGGLLVDVAQSIFVGVDLRLVGGTELDFDTISGDADYRQVAFVIGASF